MVVATAIHCTPSGPAASNPAPTRLPTKAWVGVGGGDRRADERCQKDGRSGAEGHRCQESGIERSGCTQELASIEYLDQTAGQHAA
jgi:hypothetical protein